MNPRRKKRLTLVVSIFTGLSIVIALVLYALSQNIDLFYQPSEVLKGKSGTGIKPQVNQRIRIGGIVVPGSIKRDPHSLKVSFELTDMGEAVSFTDQESKVTLEYDKILPDLFREGQGIVANGTLIAEGLIQASEVLAKHDENYVPKELADSAGKKHQKIGYTPQQLAETD